MKIGIRMSPFAALFILGATFLLRELVHAGTLDGSIGTRVAMVANGVIVALCGNAIPKTLKAPLASWADEARLQAALRSTGWAMTMAGVIYAGLWLAAPEDIAMPVSISVLAAAALYLFYRVWRCKLRKGSAVTR